MNLALCCFGVTEGAIVVGALPRIGVIRLNEDIRCRNLLLFQISFDDFSAFLGYWRPSFSTTADLTSTTHVKEVVLSFTRRMEPPPFLKERLIIRKALYKP